MNSENKFTNRLIKETSPYLLQHAHNPVDWYPWGEEAFLKAKQENKPIFLSVGYSACHWCHVMEHESFEDEETAKIMNELYINIKVDREERPDVDTIYMSVVQLLTGQGGWPMSVFLTPEQKPFFGGTYFPKERRYGMPSFKEVLNSVHRYYSQNKEDLEKNIGTIMNNLQILNNYQRKESEVPSQSIIANTLESIADYHDSFNGGFGDKPKFPNTFNLDLLLRQYQKTGKKVYLEMVETTLRKMSNGGIYDQVGGGFFRYSVDEYWLIPHFEKMLYDNSLLLKNLLEIYQVTGDSFFRKKAKESFDYVLREMTAPEGGFYSTQDADSEGEEGKYYVWTPVEIKKLAGERDGSLFCDYFGVTDYGNFEHGKSNLHVSDSVSNLLKKYRLTEAEFSNILQNVREKLFVARQDRVPPGKDTKIITAWNGLMISAFAKGYAVLEEPILLETAEKTVNFIEKKMFQDGFLLRTYKDQQAKYNAYLEDYAFLISSLVDLYQVCLKEKYLYFAKKLTEIMIANFWDEQEGGFFYTGKNHESLIVRTKEVTDHSIPSANAVAINALWRIARLTGNKKWGEQAEESLRLFSGIVRRYSLSVTGMVCTIDSYLNPPLDLVLVAEEPEQLNSFLKKINSYYQPDLLIHYTNGQEEKHELYQGKVSIEGKPTAYLCKNFTCLSPTTEPDDLVF